MNRKKLSLISLVVLSLFLVIIGSVFAFDYTYTNTLEINAPDQSTVWVDRQYKGTTPLTMIDLYDTDPNSANATEKYHYVEVFSTVGGSNSWHGIMETPAGSNTVFNTPYVTWQVSSHPAGTKFYVRDNTGYFGQLPEGGAVWKWLVQDNNPHTWSLFFKQDGYFDNVTYITASAGETKTYNAIMKPINSTGSIYVKTNVNGANVILTRAGYSGYNGQAVTLSGDPQYPYAWGMNYVDVGTWTLILSKVGYVTSTSPVQINPLQQTVASIALVQAGTLSVTSTPTGAYLYIDNVLKGVTPKTVTGLAPGNHDVRLTKTGYQTYNTVANIVSGQTTNLAVTLTP